MEMRTSCWLIKERNVDLYSDCPRGRLLDIQLFPIASQKVPNLQNLPLLKLILHSKFKIMIHMLFHMMIHMLFKMRIQGCSRWWYTGYSRWWYTCCSRLGYTCCSIWTSEASHHCLNLSFSLLYHCLNNEICVLIQKYGLADWDCSLIWLLLGKN